MQVFTTKISVFWFEQNYSWRLQFWWWVLWTTNHQIFSRGWKSVNFRPYDIKSHEGMLVRKLSLAQCLDLPKIIVNWSTSQKRKNLLCKVNSLFWRVKFFPPKFPFPKYNRKIWRERFYFAKERGYSKTDQVELQTTDSYNQLMEIHKKTLKILTKTWSRFKLAWKLW